MSLVNDMLRDLEERQDPGSQVLAGLSPGLSQRDPATPTGAKFAFVAGGALMLLAAGVWWWQNGTESTDTSLGSFATATPAAAVEQMATLTNEPSELASREPQIDARPADTEVEQSPEPFRPEEILDQAALVQTAEQETLKSEPTIQVDPTLEKVRALLASGEQALASNRLTSPIEDNAYDHYRAVLALRPGHPEAERGLREIINFYRDWAKTAFNDGDSTLALIHLERALLMRPNDEELLTLRDHFKSQATSQQTSTANKTASVAATATNEQPEIKHSNSELDRQAATTASNLVARGEVQQGIDLLKAHLVTYRDAPKSTELLAETYLDNLQLVPLQQLLATTQSLAPTQVAALQARMKLAQGDLVGARTLLEANPPAVTNDPAYHALLAGVYHKSGQPQQSVTIYRKLVTIDPGSHLHWLGLAVALDALSDRSGALQAFRQARKGSRDNTEVRDYIDQRIAALSV